MRSPVSKEIVVSVVALALGLSTAVAPTFAFAVNRPGGGGNHGGMHSGASQHFGGAAGRYGGHSRQFAGGGSYGGYGGGGYYGGGDYYGGGGYYGCQANVPAVALGVLTGVLLGGGYSYGYGNC
jgi:hypothetical protein